MLERSAGRRKTWNRGHAFQGSWRTTAAALLPPLVLVGQQLAFGANSDWLALLASTADILTALILLLLLVPDAPFWRGAWPVLTLVACSILWLCAPSLAPTWFEGLPPRLAPDLLLPGLARIFGGVAMLMAGAWLGYRRGLMKKSLRWLMLFGIVIIIIGATLRQIDPDHIWGVRKNIMGERFTGTLLNANANAALAGITALLGLSGLLKSLREGRMRAVPLPGLLWQALQIIACIAGLAACFATGSRTVSIILLLCMAGLALTDRTLRHSLLSVPGAIIALVAVTVVTVILLIGSDLTMDRFGALLSARELRASMLQHYFTLAMQSPVIGYGPLSFDVLNQQNMGDPLGALTYWYVHAPHNVVLSLMLTGGIPYLGLLALAAAMIAVRTFSIRASEKQDVMFRGALLSIILVVMSAMVDIQLDVPALSAEILFLSGLLWGRSIRVAEDRRRARP